MDFKEIIFILESETLKEMNLQNNCNNENKKIIENHNMINKEEDSTNKELTQENEKYENQEEKNNEKYKKKEISTIIRYIYELLPKTIQDFTEKQVLVFFS